MRQTIVDTAGLLVFVGILAVMFISEIGVRIYNRLFLLAIYLQPYLPQ